MATDWAALEIEYATTKISLRSLAKKHGIKAAGVLRRAAIEKWISWKDNQEAAPAKSNQVIIPEKVIKKKVITVITEPIKPNKPDSMPYVEPGNDNGDLDSPFRAALFVLSTDPDRRLDDFNESDIVVSMMLKNKAMEMLGETRSEHGLRALAGVLDTAQKIGRLALGASTANHDHHVNPIGQLIQEIQGSAFKVTDRDAFADDTTDQY